jgi:hypothetical protein
MVETDSEFIDLDDTMYGLYLTFYPNDIAIRIGFDALPSQTLRLSASSANTRKKRHTSYPVALTAWQGECSSSPSRMRLIPARSLIRLRPARATTYSFDSQQDPAHAIQHVITQPAQTQILKKLACMTFKSISQPSMNLDFESLRDCKEFWAIAIHKLTRATTC